MAELLRINTFLPAPAAGEKGVASGEEFFHDAAQDTGCKGYEKRHQRKHDESAGRSGRKNEGGGFVKETNPGKVDGVEEEAVFYKV